MSTLTDNLGLIKHASGYEGWADDMNNNLDLVDRATGNIMSMNPVINCDMSQWQRGDSFSVSGVECTADRWAASYAGCVVSKQSYNGKSILRFGRAEGETTLNCLYIGQIIDTPNAVKFRGKTITLSWRLRKGSTFSANWLNIAIMSSAAIDDTYDGSLDLLSGIVVNYATVTDDISTDFQVFTVVGTVPEDCNTLSIKIGYLPNGTADASEYIEIDWVQINIGDVALPFVPRNDTLEKMLCRRYYEIVGGNGVGHELFFSGAASTEYTVNGIWHFKVPKRVVPTISAENLSDLAVYSPLGYLADEGCTSFFVDGTSRHSVQLCTVWSSPYWTSGAFTWIRDSLSGTTKFIADAELY